MSGILQFLGDAIQPAVAARAGYLEGQDARQQADQVAQRNSILDQLKMAVDASTIRRNAALASRDLNPPTTTRTVTGADGLLYTVPAAGGSASPLLGPDGKQLKGPPRAQTGVGRVQDASGNWFQVAPDGTATPVTVGGKPLKGRVPGSTPNEDATQQRMNDAAAVSAANTQLNSDLKFVPRPSKSPGAPKPPVSITTPDGKTITTGGSPATPAYEKLVADSTDYDAKTLQPDRQRLQQAVEKQATDMGGAAPVATTGTGTPSTPADWYARAADAYKRALAGGADPATAQQEYNATVGAIAARFGSIPKQP